MESVLITEAFISTDQWQSSLDMTSNALLEAMIDYKKESTLPNLAGALKKFTQLGVDVYLRKPKRITKDHLSVEDAAQDYEEVADVLVECFLPDESDQERLAVPEIPTDEEWEKMVNFHFQEAAKIDEALAGGSAEESRLAALGSAHVARLGLLLFSKLPVEMQSKAGEFQEFYLEAAGRFLERIDGLTSAAAAEAIDYSKVELPAEVESILKSMGMFMERHKRTLASSYEYSEGQRNENKNLIKGLRDYSPGLTELQREAVLFRLIGRGGHYMELMKLSRAFFDIRRKKSIKTSSGGVIPESFYLNIPSLLSNLGISGQELGIAGELVKDFVFGGGGVLDNLMNNRIRVENFSGTDKDWGRSEWDDLVFPREWWMDESIRVPAAVAVERLMVERVDGSDAWVNGVPYLRLVDLLEIPGRHTWPPDRVKDWAPVVKICWENLPEFTVKLGDFVHKGWTSVDDLWWLVDRVVRSPVGSLQKELGRMPKETFDRMFSAIGEAGFWLKAGGEEEGNFEEADNVLYQIEHCFGYDLSRKTEWNKSGSLRALMSEDQLMFLFEAMAECPEFWQEGEKLTSKMAGMMVSYGFYPIEMPAELTPDAPWREASGLYEYLTSRNLTRQDLRDDLVKRKKSLTKGFN